VSASPAPGRPKPGDVPSGDRPRYAAAQGPIFQQQRAIRFSDCDPAAIVFYPQYFVMFNALVEDWVTEALGISYRHLVVERRVGMPTVRLEVDFRAVSRMGDKVLLALEVERLGRRSITLLLRCTGADGQPRMSMRQVLVTTSLDTHASIDIPADLRAAIARDTGPSE
jgi:4-hydroxybenzoyl-CoA thioesterase